MRVEKFLHLPIYFFRRVWLGIIGIAFLSLAFSASTVVEAQTVAKHTGMAMPPPAVSPAPAKSVAAPKDIGPGKCTNANGLSVDEITDLLSAHNKVRAKLNLGGLAWDCKLAEFAQEWAQRGIPEHRPDSDFGENIFVGSADDIKPVTAVDRWLLEKPMWFNEAGACTFNQICTHYTQLVWRKTTKVGCGIIRNSPSKWKVLLVCNYDPAGNYPGPAY